MNKKVIYTCLVGNYDALPQPEVIDESFDYICFSDKVKEGKIGSWEMRTIPFAHNEQSCVSRYPKLLPHNVLAEYEYSVYIDANIQITHQSFYEAVNAKITSDCIVAQVRHTLPPIDCTYDEISYAYKYERVSFWQAWRHICYLRRNHFPCHFGLFENNLILRKHNDELVKTLSIQWWDEYLRGPHRDQFSLMYVYWKNNFMPECLLGENECTRNSPWLKYNNHLWELQQEIPLTKRLKRYIHWYGYPIVKMIFSCSKI